MCIPVVKCYCICLKFQDSGARQKRSNYWTRLRKKWNRKGVVEIDVDHHRYDMLECIREGLRDLIVTYPELGPKVNDQGFLNGKS